MDSKNDHPPEEGLDFSDENVVQLPIDGTLDLHTFSPGDVKDLVPDYLAECLNAGIYEVRIVHGKGIGALRETVHARLRRRADVARFRLGGADSGGWGATLVELKDEPAAF